jgi:hypothetical protein
MSDGLGADVLFEKGHACNIQVWKAPKDAGEE